MYLLSVHLCLLKPFPVMNMTLESDFLGVTMRGVENGPGAWSISGINNTVVPALSLFCFPQFQLQSKKIRNK